MDATAEKSAREPRWEGGTRAVLDGTSLDIGSLVRLAATVRACDLVIAVRASRGNSEHPPLPAFTATAAALRSGTGGVVDQHPSVPGGSAQ